MNKIFVCCPANIVTGGPELLHQLVSELRAQGHEAYITYLPHDQSNKTPGQYMHYRVAISALEDTPGNVVIFPEIFTQEAARISRAKAVIWWLSIDNYYCARHESKLKDLAWRYLSLLKRRSPLFTLRKLTHWSQSVYAQKYLLQHRINSEIVGDYIYDICPEAHGSEKLDIIAYNPKKGAKRTQTLIRENPDLRFVALENMTSKEVSKTLSTAKIYIDFGHHPGKDRMPREAALAGCCIITGSHGAAANPMDIPIPGKFKLNDHDGSYATEFRTLVDQIFQDFPAMAAEFDSYRSSIRREHQEFKNSVARLLPLASLNAAKQP